MGKIKPINQTTHNKIKQCADCVYFLSSRIDYNRVRPHSALDYRTPESFIFFIQNASNQMLQKRGA